VHGAPGRLDLEVNNPGLALTCAIDIRVAVRLYPSQHERSRYSVLHPTSETEGPQGHAGLTGRYPMQRPRGTQHGCPAAQSSRGRTMSVNV